MADFSSSIGEIGTASQGALFTTVWISVGILVLGLILLMVSVFIWKRNKYNLKVEIKMPRNDGRIINGEWGIGSYDAKRGVVLIKRNKSKAIPVKIFDIKRYLQGQNLITVIQVGPNDYRPVLNDSWTEHEVTYMDMKNPAKDKDGKPLLDDNGQQLYKTYTVKDSILNIKTESEENKAWKAAWEEAAKQAYTIQSFLRQYQAPIAIGVVVLCCFVGFAILWTKLSGVCS